MAGVTIFQRAQRNFSVDPAARGHHVVYRANELNRCPGCGRGQWYVGRMTAECGFCGTAVALAEAEWSGAGVGSPERAREPVVGRAKPIESVDWAERRRHERLRTVDRTLQLLIDGSPHSFAIHNLSAGGLMGDDPVGLDRFARVHVRFEGGILVPAVVRWTDGPLAGLAFESPVLLDLSRPD